jgi:dihydrodipicolinate synthase/N-acetylneuraminate lyase
MTVTVQAVPRLGWSQISLYAQCPAKWWLSHASMANGDSVGGCSHNSPSTVGASSTHAAVQLARHAEKAGAGAISALPPVGGSFSPPAIWGHFKAIGDATSLPFYLYHLPQLYGDVITVDTLVKAMDSIPTLAGAKFSSYRIDDLIKLKVLAGGRLNLLSSCGEQLLSAAVCGAEGSIVAPPRASAIDL